MGYSNLPFLGMGPAELHLITKSPLNFCCLLGRISQPLLNEYSRMQISRSTVRPGSHQLFLNAATLWLSAPGAAPQQPGGWSRLDSLSGKTSQHRNEFLLSATLPLVFPSGENFEVELVRCRRKGCIKPVRSPGSRFHQIRSSHLKLATPPNPSEGFMFIYVK